MKKITINEAVLALEALEIVQGSLSAHQKYQVGKVQKILQESLEIARPLLTGEEQKDQWLATATTLPFEPLVLKECFGGIKKIDPANFLALKRLCS